MRGASVNFKSIRSSLHAVAHANREVAPSYLLPADVSLGAHIVIDDKGAVQSTLQQKLSLASRQAKATKDYSPLWEGVVNLPSPNTVRDRESDTGKLLLNEEILKQKTIIKTWCSEYSKLTGHTVLRADVHLDEGHIDDDGQPQFNAHAHVMLDRTDSKGKVLKLDRAALRAVQDMTAEITGLARGQSAMKSGRKHIEHQAYRYLAEKGRLDPDKHKQKDAEIKVLKDTAADDIANLQMNILKLKEAYAKERADLKASGEATQRDYQNLKIKHEETLAELKAAKAEKPQPDKDLAFSQMRVASIVLQENGQSPDKRKQSMTKHFGDVLTHEFLTMPEDKYKKTADQGARLMAAAIDFHRRGQDMSKEAPGRAQEDPGRSR